LTDIQRILSGVGCGAPDDDHAAEVLSEFNAVVAKIVVPLRRHE
jgi:hypothetical protein